VTRPRAGLAVFLATLLAAMLAALVYGFGWGGGWAEVRELLAFPWFVVSLVDVYVCFALIGVWIASRETPARAAAWIAALLLLGSAVACVYALLALRAGAGPTARRA